MAFVDLRKAFDRVWREGLWAVLEEKGLGGKFLSIVKGIYSGHKRKIDIGNDQTEWIDCRRGVKQGCCLSPVLFAIYLADLGTRLKATKGVKMGNATIPGIFFADDMIQTAETVDDLGHQLAILRDFVTERRLEINFQKTQIMKLGQGCGDKNTWTLTDGQGTELGRIEETNFYDYLGVRLGRSRTFQQYRTQKQKQIPRKLGLLKVKSRNTPSRTRAANAMWRQAVKPALLYGAELVTYTKEWTDKMESLQSKIARWILGVRRTTPPAGLRAELGWNSIEDDIEERKMAYWERLIRLPEERWTKQALHEVLKGQFRSEWYEKLIKARGKVVSDPIATRSRHWKGALKRVWRAKGRTDWKKIKQTNTVLAPHPKENIQGSGDHIWLDSKKSRNLNKLRLGDFGAKWGADKGVCKSCDQDNIRDMRAHLLLDCTKYQDLRTNGPVGTKISECGALNMTRVETIQEILAGTSSANMEHLYNIATAWEADQI